MSGRRRRRSRRARQRAGSDVSTASDRDDSLEPKNSDNDQEDLFEGSHGTENDDEHAVNNICVVCSIMFPAHNFTTAIDISLVVS